MKRLIAILTTIMLLANVFCMSPTVFAVQTDAKKMSYIKGYEDGTFRPEENMTRAEAASMIAHLIADDNVIKGTCSFADVENTQWYYKSIAYLESIGYLSRYKGTFNPDAAITRADFLELVYKTGLLKSNELKEFSDVSEEHVLYEIICKAGGSGLIKGYEDGTFRPDNTITRAEVVMIINRALGGNDDESSIESLKKDVFSDVNKSYWAYFDIIKAAGVKESAVLTSNYGNVTYDVYNKAGNEWVPVPLVTQEQREMGMSGGEGGQWLLSIVCDPIDAHLLFAGVDVGTILRSTDGGATWEHSARGLLSQGANSFAIDPHNLNRVLAVGCGQKAQDVHGIYLSTDEGASWKQVLSSKIAGHRDIRDQIAFDPSSYDEKIGGSAVAYWSRAWVWDAGADVKKTIEHEEGEEKGLFKSVDGGETWKVVNEDMTDGYVKVHPTNGTIYVANHKGFHKSTDGGKTFKTILSGVIQGLDVIPTQPDNVYINDYMGVLVSTDCGETFKRIPNTGYPMKTDLTDIRNIVRGLKVSPANPNNMLITNASFLDYKNKRYYSHDGGRTWNECAYDESKDFFKVNNRQQVFAWHPTNENKVWGLGGDWVVSSSDAGKTFTWDNEGNVGVYVAGRSCFNIYNPDLFYFGSQDFHGAVTYDYGKTWKHIWKFTNEWAGFVYGGYAADESTFIACVSKGWSYPRYLYVTRDGGETWKNTELQLKNGVQKWASMCMQSPNNPNILFAGEYRSDDKGETWSEMENCYVACAYNPYGRKELYGIYKDKVVVSYDEGKTWEEYVTVKKLNDDPTSGTIWDIAYDGINNILYYVSGTSGSGRLLCAVDKNKVTTDLTANLIAQPHNGVKSFQLVTVDPRYPDIVYVGGYANANVNETGVQRSCDGGKTFQVLSTVNQDISIVKTGPSGGKEPSDFFVHPTTGELWCANGCIGWTKIAPPYKN